MQKEEEIQRQEDELLQKEDLKHKQEDAEDQERRLAQQRAEYEELERQKQTSVIRLGLPRPLNASGFQTPSGSDPLRNVAEQLILQEVEALINNDNLKHPLKGAKEAKAAPFLDIHPSYIAEARKLILDECGSSLHYPLQPFTDASFDLDSQSLYFPGSKSFDSVTAHSLAEQIESFRWRFDLARKRMERELSRCEKLEDKGLRVLFGGYYKREEALRALWETTMQEHRRLLTEEDVFRVLESQEARSLRTRLSEAHQAVALQEAKENELQRRYADLKAERERLEKTIAFHKKQQ